MSGKQNKGRNPEKRTAKRQRQREAAERGSVRNEKSAKPSQSQMTHASSNRARKKAAEGERAMRAEHPDAGQADGMVPEDGDR